MGRKSYSKVGAVDNTPKQKDSNNPSVQSDVAVYDSDIYSFV